MSTLDSLRAAWRDAEHPPDGATAAWRLIPALEAEVERLQARERALEAALGDAIECVESWAAYASDYFREKHDLAGDLARLRTPLAAVSAETEDDDG